MRSPLSYVGSALRESDNQIFLPQNLNSFAHGHSRHTMFLLQVALTRQRLILCQFPGLDLCPEDGGKLPVQRLRVTVIYGHLIKLPT